MTPSTPTWSSGFPPTVANMASGPRFWSTSAITTMRLMTNNPAKYGGLEGFGLEIYRTGAVADGADRAEHRVSADQTGTTRPPSRSG